MSTELSGRTALVTGATAVAADIDPDGAERIAAEVGGRPWTIDLADLDALASLELDIDVLVNNAGVQTVSPLTDFDPQRFRTIIDLMLTAPFLLVRAGLPKMYERNFGRLVSLPVHGLRASPYKAA